MKRFGILLLICCVLLSACGGETETEPTETTVFSVPQELVGAWVSADGGGERQMLETITFGEDGSLMVHLDYQGSPYSTIYGTYTVDGANVHCEITEGAEAFTVDYAFRIDGRELYLTGDDGDTAHYLRSA